MLARTICKQIYRIKADVCRHFTNSIVCSPVRAGEIVMSKAIGIWKICVARNLRVAAIAARRTATDVENVAYGLVVVVGLRACVE